MKTLPAFTKSFNFTNFFPVKLLCFLFCIVYLTNCQENKQAQLLSSLKRLDPEMRSSQFYVIIPNQGCDGCISNMEDFVIKNHQAYTDVKFIFTRITSKKILKLRLGKDLLSQKNIVLDFENSVIFPEKEQEIYPMVVCIQNDHVSDIFYQSPFEDGISILSKKISENANQ